MRWNKNESISISPLTYICAALALLVLPLEWLLSASIAAAFHELCHYLAVRFCGGQVTGIRIGCSGIIMDLRPLNRWREIFCALAGPMGSFFLVLCIRWIPLIGMCAAIQGIFNMLPLYPLDGGRALRCGLELLIPRHADIIFRCIEWAATSLILLSGFFCTLKLKLGIIPISIALALTIKILSRKRPCKDCRLGVQ